MPLNLLYLSRNKGLFINLNHVQERLQNIYEIDNRYQVEDFITHDYQLAGADVAEKLLLRESYDSLDVALFLDQLLLTKLSQDDPLERLHQNNLSAFCTVLEGISHFVYLAWNAEYERSITAFELELQAEVDKYIMLLSILAEQSGGKIPANLHRTLFEKITFHAHLSHSEYQRYYLANYYARHYCYNLHRQLVTTPDCISVTRELRRFYRLLKRQKLYHIQQLPLLN